MDVWTLIAFVVGLIIGGVIMVFAASGKINSIADDAYDILSKNNIGNLRIDRSDPDEPYMFLELETSREFKPGEHVVLTVVEKNFVEE